MGVELNADNHRQLWIPPGLAHGFLVLTETADFLYKTTEFYSPADEGAVRWDDPDVAIAWPDLGEAPKLVEPRMPRPGWTAGCPLGRGFGLQVAALATLRESKVRLSRSSR